MHYSGYLSKNFYLLAHFPHSKFFYDLKSMNYSDIFIADAGFLMMCAGAVFFLAEVLGIIEEIV